VKAVTFIILKLYGLLQVHEHEGCAKSGGARSSILHFCTVDRSRIFSRRGMA